MASKPSTRDVDLARQTPERRDNKLPTAELDAKLALAIESGNAQVKRLQEELVFVHRECDEVRKQYERSMVRRRSVSNPEASYHSWPR